MELRIGIAESLHTVDLDLSDSIGREELKKQINTALESQKGVLWLEDKKGKSVAIGASKIAWVQIGETEEQRIGFGASG